MLNKYYLLANRSDKLGIQKQKEIKHKEIMEGTS